ncbi:hypothetical protein [Sulfurovum sp.]|uniref:hypothetical protein n=1 Tax=Sulfurovum sp. TaxID=1969726 RepID=UPI0035632F1C
MSKFTPFDLEICVDEYVFDITITYLYVQKPMGQYADSDVDCYGYTELSFECYHVLEYLEDDTEMHYNGKEAQDIADEYAELLEEKVMVELEEMKNDYYD